MTNEAKTNVKNSVGRLVFVALPVFGLCIYFLFGRTNATKKVSERYRQIDDVLIPKLQQKEKVMEVLEQETFPIASHARYIRDRGSFPIYDNTKAEFFFRGEGRI